MHTLARSPVREASLNRQAGNRAFTLIELLTVIAIIAILAGITFGVVKGVNERAAISQARAELSALSQALEAYKMQYGDYPQTTDPAVFLQSLIGKKGPTGADMARKVLIEVGKFTLSSASGDPFTTSSITLIDPWGRNYLYYYYSKTESSSQTRRGYILYSTGPDGKNTAPTPLSGATGGDAKLSDANNLDNIYANK